MCNKTPQYLLAMAYSTINPKTGFPFSYDGEPFASYHKTNEFKVGNDHLICEVLRRPRLDPNRVGVRWGNNDQQKPKYWSPNIFLCG